MTFEEFKIRLDTDLGLTSSVYESEEGQHRYLEYHSPTGVLLFTLYVENNGHAWRVVPIGDLLPGFFKDAT